MVGCHLDTSRYLRLIASQVDYVAQLKGLEEGDELMFLPTLETHINFLTEVYVSEP